MTKLTSKKILDNHEVEIVEKDNNSISIKIDDHIIEYRWRVSSWSIVLDITVDGSLYQNNVEIDENDIEFIETLSQMAFRQREAEMKREDKKVREWVDEL